MSLRTFKVICIIEAITWMTLICASIAKRAFGMEWTTMVVGPIHGTAFLIYFCGLLMLRDDLGWGLKKTAIGMLASLIPLGTWLIVERRWLHDVEEPLAPSLA